MGHRVARAVRRAAARRRSCSSAAATPTAPPRPGPGEAAPPKQTAEVLDLDDPEAGWQLGEAPSLNTGRSHFNTVLLPDGGIFSNGGGYGRKDDTLYADPVYQAELLRPGATSWTRVGSEADARTYHSVSVLLPDGRVASAGDDRDVAPSHIAVKDRTAQIWSPPYLFAGPRPVVTFAPSAVRYATTFRVAVAGDPATVTRAALVRPASVTHAVDMAQRMITLDVTAQADGHHAEHAARRHRRAPRLVHAVRDGRRRRPVGGVVGAGGRRRAGRAAPPRRPAPALGSVGPRRPPRRPRRRGRPRPRSASARSRRRSPGAARG